MLVGKPILAGISDSHQLEMIWDLCGSPTPDNMPSWNALPGSQGLTPRARPGDLAMRFKEYVSSCLSTRTATACPANNIDLVRLQFLY